MLRLDRTLASFGKAYALAVGILATIAFIVSRQFSMDFIGLLQTVLLWVGGAYVIASILAWTGFGNLYRFSPTLYIGSPSYRSIVAGGKIAEEGRDMRSLLVGSLFGLSLFGTAFALSGWTSAAVTLVIAIAAIIGYSARHRTPSRPRAHP